VKQLTLQPIALGQAETADWIIWDQLAQLARKLDPRDWVLVGGQMVALHSHIAGVLPMRTSRDIDLVANVIARPGVLARLSNVMTEVGLVPQPSADDRRLHRFVGDDLVVDVMIPDHLPRHLLPRLVGRNPVAIAGGQRALIRAATADIVTASGTSTIPVPDLIGALVLKARASIVDRRDGGRHLLDLAHLSALVDDPIELRTQLDAKELRSLRKVTLTTSAVLDPWIRLEPTLRDRAIEAWRTLIGDAPPSP